MQILSSVAHIQPYFRAFFNVFYYFFKLFMGGATPHEIWGEDSYVMEEDSYPMGWLWLAIE